MPLATIVENGVNLGAENPVISVVYSKFTEIGGAMILRAGPVLRDTVPTRSPGEQDKKTGSNSSRVLACQSRLGRDQISW